MARLWFQCKRFPNQNIVIRPKNRVLDKEGNSVVITGKYLDFHDGVAWVDSKDSETLEKLRSLPDYANGLITEHEDCPGITVAHTAVLTNGVDSGKREPVVAAKAPVSQPVSGKAVKTPKRRK